MHIRVSAAICWMAILACSGEDERPGTPPGLGGAGTGTAGTSGPVAGRTSGAGGQTDAGSPGTLAGSGGAQVSGAGGVADGGAINGGAGDEGIAGAQMTGGAGSGTGGGVAVDPCASDAIEEPPTLASLCDPSASWGEGTRVPLPGEGGEDLVAITPDELTVVWSAALGPSRLYFVADRGSPDDAFESATKLPDGRVFSVTSDGLGLIVASDDQAQLFERRRVSRGGAFGEPIEGEFTALNADAAEEAASFGNVVVSSDERTLYYTLFAPEFDEYPMRASTRSAPGIPWPVGEPLVACEFKAYEHQGQYPSGLSSDGLTFFYEDDARREARAAYRATTGAEFTYFVGLGARFRPQPNLACDRLYYSEPGVFGVYFALVEP